MASGDEPQLGGQASDNSPMIRGRGTKIIVSARGAYQAGNLQALFDTMDSYQQVMFRQSVVRQILDLIRDDVERAVEFRPRLSEMLHQLEQWLIAPTQENAEPMNGPHVYDLRAAERIPPLEFRLRELVLGAVYTRYNAIEYAIGAILFVPSHTYPQQPHWAVLHSETREWIIEVGWAILHGREVPPLLIDPLRIESLATDSERWYRKKNLAILVHLLTADQRAQLRHAIYQQVMWYIDRVPVPLWSADYWQVIERARLLAVPVTFRAVTFNRVKEPFRKSGGLSPMNALMGVFEEADFDHYGLDVPYANCVLRVVEHIMWKVDGKKYPHSNRARETARRWQVEAAWAILHDQPIPPLEVSAEE